MMPVSEHIAWTKQRALEYVDMGNVTIAYSSLVTDLNAHPETQGHDAIMLGMMLMMAGQLSTPQEMRTFIEGVR